MQQFTIRLTNHLADPPPAWIPWCRTILWLLPAATLLTGSGCSSTGVVSKSFADSRVAKAATESGFPSPGDVGLTAEEDDFE